MSSQRHSVRVNLGLFQRDVNVLWDLAVHDLSIMDYVLPHRACAVSVTGMASLGPTVSIAYLTCFFEDRFIAHFHVNWLAPVKIRRTLIGGSQKMIVYDDLEPADARALGVGEHLAVLGGHQRGELVDVLLHQLLELEHDPGAPQRRRVRPVRERRGGGGHRLAHLGLARQWNLGRYLAGRRVEHVAEAAARPLHLLAVEVMVQVLAHF